MTTGEETRLRQAALAALDRLIAEAPPATADDAIAALRQVVALRDHLSARLERQAGVAGQLACINAVLSLVWSGAVPIVGFRRQHLRQACQTLQACDVESTPNGRSA